MCHSGDVYRTRELTPFLECVDNSPVVRSVLPKLLLQYRYRHESNGTNIKTTTHFFKNGIYSNNSISASFDQAKAHIQNYLKNLQENVLDREDCTELYLLFVNCFQVKDTTLSALSAFHAIILSLKFVILLLIL